MVPQDISGEDIFSRTQKPEGLDFSFLCS
ncbi:hypothetical protein BN1200_880028 [Klebsiella variicola]|nr:hypothetical protein BN1200_880028 [Klebsiella variicola]